ncbi:hypothetical protein ABT095_30640 [Kitasatospora sp. NPDC002227]|uniref:hypothetical protein n=1 Tax=Kitasatospora sp. NPDC002227 TaxID=3154773 RepID=UPI003317FE9E
MKKKLFVVLAVAVGLSLPAATASAWASGPVKPNCFVNMAQPQNDTVTPNVCG